jgi:probable HAF family extracellular repeat protein
MPTPSRIALALSGGLGVTLALATPVQYRLAVLPVPPNCQAFSQLHGLGDGDRVAGVMSCDAFATWRAVYWENGRLAELGTLGGPNSYAYALGGNGEIVGVAETPEIYQGSDHVGRAVVWVNDVPRDLGTLGGRLGAALAVNASGTIVGGCQREADPTLGREPMRACLWLNGTAQDLGDLGGEQAAAYDVNERGCAVGWSDTSQQLPSGFGPIEHAFLVCDGAMADLGTLGGLVSNAWALNNRGEVVGRSCVPAATGCPYWHAFLWRDGEQIDLGTLGGPYSDAYGINDRGDIVGWSSLPTPIENSFDRAVMWARGRLLDLNDLVVNREDWVLEEAWAIDARGRIVVNMHRDGQWSVGLLTPVPRRSTPFVRRSAP